MPFPPDVLEPREVENAMEIEYNPDDKFRFYAEDFQNLCDHIVDVEEYLLTEPWGSGGGGGSFIQNFFHDSFEAFVGAPLTQVALAGQFTNTYSHQVPQQINNVFGIRFYMPSTGMAILKLLSISSTAAGIAEIYLDDDLLCTVDFYSTGAVYNIKYLFPIESVSSGWHTIKLKTVGKYTSSTNYGIPVSKITIEIPNVLPSFFEVRPDMFQLLAGSVIFRQYDTTQTEGYLIRHASASDGDSGSLLFACPAGDYEIDVKTLKYSGNGIIDLYVDDVKLLTWDGYNSTTLSNQSFTIEADGLDEGIHELKYIVNGKNASSSGYRVYFSNIIFRKVA